MRQFKGGAGGGSLHHMAEERSLELQARELT
jgi:hypothetical protein